MEPTQEPITPPPATQTTDIHPVNPPQQQVIMDGNPPAKKNTSIVLIFLIIILLVLIGVIGFLLFRKMQLRQAVIESTPIALVTQAPTAIPDPTANWKTYTDSSNTISFKYPADFAIHEVLVSSSAMIGSKLYGITPTFDQAIAKLCPTTIDKKASCTQSTTGPITNSVQFDTVSTTSPTTEILVKNGNTIYEISYSGSDKNTLNNIFTTFKFVTSTPLPTAVGAGS